MSIFTNYLRMNASDAHTTAEVDREAEILSPGHIRRCTDEAGILSPADQRAYVTRGEHDGIPEGTSCLVSRPDGGMKLRLDFPDGRVVWTTGHAAGIEWRIEHALLIDRTLQEMRISEVASAHAARLASEVTDG